MKLTTLLTILIGILLQGCQTPYTQPLTVDDFIDMQGADTVCLNDGFDAVCIKTIPGDDGKDGKDGKDGNDGNDGKDGKDGKDAQPISLTIDDGSDAATTPQETHQEQSRQDGGHVDTPVPNTGNVDSRPTTVVNQEPVCVDCGNPIVYVNAGDPIPNTMPVVNPRATPPITTCEVPDDNAHCAPDPEQAEKNKQEYLFEDPDQGFVAYRHEVETGKTVRKQVLTPAGAPKRDSNNNLIYEEVPEVLVFSGIIGENSVIVEGNTLISAVTGAVIAENAEIVAGDTEDEAWENLD